MEFTMLFACKLPLSSVPCHCTHQGWLEPYSSFLLTLGLYWNPGLKGCFYLLTVGGFVSLTSGHGSELALQF